MIEDNPDILENLTEYMQIEGYHILATSNGKMGIELAREFVPDLIICDSFMYGMNGHEVLRLLLATPITAKIPFIFSTSMSDSTDRLYALALGADDYIVKPFELETLLNMTRTCINTGSKRQKTII